MEYVAILRARRVLTWYGGILGAALLMMLYGVLTHHPTVQTDNPHAGVPLSALIAGAAVAAVTLAAFLAAGFDAEYKTAAIAFTRPLSRIRIAQRFVLVAAVAMLVAFVATLAAIFIVIASMNALKYITMDGGLNVPLVLAALGCAAMWYGLVVLVAALFPGRGGTIVGLSWAYALIVPAFAHADLPVAFHALFSVLQYLDPLAYVGSIGSAHQGTPPLGIESVGVRAAMAWAIGAAALASGVTLWAKREVPA